jgi:hypothetical protein
MRDAPPLDRAYETTRAKQTALYLPMQTPMAAEPLDTFPLAGA